MANILDFTPRAQLKTGMKKADRHQPDAPAEIIIFPGIRYERIKGEQAGSARRDVALRLTGTVPALLQR
ncbi:hypothetical protein JYU29_04140 [Tianweitania sp. BSSL-BM11]|uniref:Transposase n=1 Tax=Tianweitania aestuarii TaxID=2814886 RepID=A0ABS5RS47_9HYPH|nr:hypothetical protein [Tianweitania aestuarii]MBS9719875.1 hypothetical protein [Tianweitania aestuarii]